MTMQPSTWVITVGTLLNSPDVIPMTKGQNFIGEKTPEWSTAVMSAVAGREVRRQNWSYPRWSFKLSFDFIKNPPAASDLVRLFAFFNSHAGKYKEFFYYDPEDNVLPTDQAIGIGNGVTTKFQAVRTMTNGGISFTEPVQGFYGAPVVKVNGVTTAYTIDPYGVIVFASAPASGHVITYNGNFLFLCRFEDDTLSAAQMVSRLWNVGSFNLQGIKQ